MADSKIDGLSVAAIGAGGLLLYAGIKGKSIPAALLALIHGKSPATAANANTITGTAAAAGGGQGGGGQGGGPAPPGGGSDSANRALGRILAASYGWSTGAEWKALDYGWGTLESGWNNQIYNGGQIGGAYQPGKAYGIPQFLGHGSNGAPYPDGDPANPPGAGGTSSATAQIRDGLGYVHDKYGSPTQVPGWTGGPYGGY